MVGILFLLAWPILFDGPANAQVRLTETGGGTEYVGFQSPAAITTNLLWTLPAVDGGANQCLVTNGSATLQWITPLTSSSGFLQNGNSFTALATLGTNDAYGLNFETSGLPRMSIAAGGNVGIGTTSPVEKLQVAGNINATGDIYSGTASGAYRAVLSGGSSDGLFLGYNSSNSVTVRITSNGSSYLNGGNVGIGTTSPIGNLDVYNGGFGRFTTHSNLDPGGFNAATVWGSTTAGAQGLAIGVNRSAGGRETNFVNLAPGYTPGGFTFDTWNGSSYAQRMKIDSNGNVGVGTTGPDSKLTTWGAITDTVGSGILNLGATGDRSYWSLRLDGSADLAFDSYVTGWNNRFFIDRQSGNVGIGTTSPSDLLHVVKANDVWIKAQSSTAGGAANAGTSVVNGNAVEVSLNAYGWEGYAGTTTNHKFELMTNNTSRLIIDTSGNVGIGTAAPAYKLDVAGSIGVNAIRNTGGANFHLDTMGTGGMYFNYFGGSGGVYVMNGAAGYGPIAASAFNINSDQRLKTNIAEIDDGLTIVNQLSGVRFDWVDSKESNSRQMGVIAQEVEKVLPELVSTNQENKMLTVNYSGLVAPLIAAVKELYNKWLLDHKTIEQLKAADLAKDRKIQSLESENREIRAYLCEQDSAAPICKR